MGVWDLFSVSGAMDSTPPPRPMVGGEGAFGVQKYVCSVHQKSRTLENLDPDGMGGFRCRPDTECGKRPELLPGDWVCLECGAHNWAKRTECLKCSNPKPQPQLTEWQLYKQEKRIQASHTATNMRTNVALS